MLSWFIHYLMPKDERAKGTEESVSTSPLMAGDVVLHYESAFRNLEEISKQPTGQFIYHLHDNKLL